MNYERKTKENIRSVQIAMKHTVTTLYKDKNINQQLASEIEKKINDFIEKQEKTAYNEFREKVKKYYEDMDQSIKNN